MDLEIHFFGVVDDLLLFSFLNFKTNNSPARWTQSIAIAALGILGVGGLPWPASPVIASAAASQVMSTHSITNSEESWQQLTLG